MLQNLISGSFASGLIVVVVLTRVAGVPFPVLTALVLAHSLQEVDPAGEASLNSNRRVNNTFRGTYQGLCPAYLPAVYSSRTLILQEATRRPCESKAHGSSLESAIRETGRQR